MTEAPDAPRVLIIGAGFGGLGCAHGLKAAGSTAAITIVDAQDKFTIGGTWQFVWNGRMPSDGQTHWPLESASKLLPNTTLNVNTSVQALDVKAKAATLADGSVLKFDYLVLSPGAVSDPSSVAGLAEGSLDIYTFSSVAKQRTQLADFVSLAKERAAAADAGKATLLIPIAKMPYKCPVAPFEVAFLVDDALRAAGLRDAARIVITCPVAWPLPDPAKAAFTERMKEKDIEFMAEWSLVELKPSDAGAISGTAVYTEKEPFVYDLCWAVYPLRAPEFVTAAGLTNESGFVPVNLVTNRLSNAAYGDVPAYCIGDCCAMVVAGKPHPKAGEFAWQMGQSVAKQIDASIREAECSGFERKGACFAECGSGAALLLAPDFTKCLEDPEAGKPKVEVTDAPAPDGEAAKVAWVNRYIQMIFGTTWEYSGKTVEAVEG